MKKSVKAPKGFHKAHKGASKTAKFDVQMSHKKK